MADVIIISYLEIFTIGLLNKSRINMMIENIKGG